MPNDDVAVADLIAGAKNITRLVDAPRERVFKAWTEAELLKAGR